MQAMVKNDYNSDPAFRACNINIDKRLIAFQGRVLPAPEVKQIVVCLFSVICDKCLFLLGVKNVFFLSLLC